MICNFQPQNSQAGVSVITIAATDGDGDSVTYAVVSGRVYFIYHVQYGCNNNVFVLGDDPAPNNKFTINSETGLIETTSITLDRENLIARDFIYTLFIEGTDNGGTMGDTNRSVSNIAKWRCIS